MTTPLCYPLAELVHVCSHAAPYAMPLRVLGHQLLPKWFAPREIPAQSCDEMHVHHLYEAHLCLAGHGEFTLETTQPVGPGSVAIYPPRTHHTMRTGEDGGVFLWMGFAVNPAVHVREPVRWPVWPTLLRDVEIMLDECRGNARGWEERAGLRLSLMLARLLSLSEARATAPPVLMNYDGLAQEVDRYCEMYYAQPVRLDDIADYFHLSPRTLMRQYRARTGNSVMDYLQQVRLRKAAWLLRHSALPIMEIAHACGLQPNHFTRIFHAHHGVTPTEYRRDGNGNG